MTMPIPGGDLERAVLEAVWALDEPTAREVHERVGEPRGLVYTTIAKVLDRLHDKGLVARHKVGQAFVYRAKRERGLVTRALTRDVIGRVLGSEPKPAIAALVDAVEEIDPALLDELARTVNARRRKRRGP